MSSRFGSKTDSGIIRNFIESYDGDAANYFAANTAIVNEADKTAINDFYLGLKSDGIYTKIKAMYLPIWGSAASSKWNLVNPLDTNAAFRLTFATGMTFTSIGMTSNGTTGYADTFLVPSSFYSTNMHLSYYSRTSTIGNVADMGSSQIVVNTNYSQLAVARTSIWGQTTNGLINYLSQANALGFFIGQKVNNSSRKVFRNGVVNNSTTTTDSNPLPNKNIYIGCLNDNGTAAFYSSKQCSFASIGDGLTDTEVTNFSNRVNTLLAYFGINTYPAVSDVDAQAYINANNAITSQSDANAINTFFTGLKSDGIYTKIKAMYLPIWGSASASKWNLVNPADTDAAYRLTFATGMTFTSSGMTSNGTSAYALTHLIPNTNLTNNNTHLSIYSRTNNDGVFFDIGSGKPTGQYIDLVLRISGNAQSDQYNSSTGRISTTNSNSQGFYVASRTASNVHKLFKNNTQLGTTNTGASTGFTSINDKLSIAALNEGGTFKYYTTRQYPFASIGDGLTDAEASNFYTRVNTLMTYFGINV